VLSIAAEPAPARPSWTALSDAAAHAPDTRQLLAVALVAASRQAANPGAVDSETTALRTELDETNLGMLALHAELSHRESQLEEARASAEHANHATAAFLANMSHEIRAPMNAVVGFTSLLLETDLTAEQLEYAHAVRTAGRHMLGVIEDILDLSKIESGRLELEEISFDLYACVEDAVGMLALTAADKQLPVAALFTPGVPAVVRGDPLRLGQVLVNLLANAVKFTNRGQVTVEVTAEAIADGDGVPRGHRLTFQVADTGRGIDPGVLERIFDPFTQADASTARSHGGTGLGLAICKQLAEQMGGAIAVESTVGQGSAFTCTVQTQLSTAAAALSDTTLFAGTRVVVVHRSALVVESIHRHLVSWGAEVVTALSVEDAVDRAGRTPPADLVFVDADHPAGRDQDASALALAGLADVHGNAPVVAIAALTARRTRAHAGQVVSTPIRRAHLREAVTAALGRSGPRPGPSGAAPGQTPTGASAQPAAAGAGGRTVGVVADPGPHGPSRGAPVEAPPVRRVLYVDDNPMMVELVERILGKDPHVLVQTAPDGKTALRLAVDDRPHLILLDLNLTDIGGEELMRELRANGDTGSIPVVIVSGDAAPATIARLTAQGAAGYLTKPFQPAQLRELIESTATPGPLPPRDTDS
jgi:signal transduction histidine kinase/CheY-like chemotaxis protein